MTIIAIDSLLSELPDAPCGPNLEYDPDFLALEQAALGKPEVQYGGTITPAEPPDWKLVEQQALALLARSRDLRVASALLPAMLALHGTPGLADALRLIERLLDERWDSVHPQLDPDDDLDPMLRINSLAMLSDATTVIQQVKERAFLHLPSLGPLTLRMLEMANGELAVPEGQMPVALSSIEAAIGDLDPARLSEALAAASAAHDSAVNIEVLLVRRVGSAQALNLSLLTRNLKRMRDFLASQLPSAAALPEQGAPGAAPTDAAPKTGAITGEIASRADVVRMLDKILAYYASQEPSSPVPMLLERAKRLAPKSFFEIMQDLAPDSLGQLSVIRGPQEEQ